MEFHHRKLLLPKSVSKNKSLNEDCDECGKPPPFNYDCSPPPPPPLQSKQTPHHYGLSILIPMLCVLGASFLFLCYLTFFKKYRANTNNSGVRTRNPPQFEDTHEDFIDENQGPILDNPIWYIHTIGLQQSIIDSIAVFKYKKDEVLIEGTDCSVCLNEFQEDETLRLLPKCSHAFHIPCIDTWLRSHKNCPLCRAPIVCESNNDHPSTVSEPNFNDLGPREENLENHHVGEDGTSEISDDNEVLGEFSTEEEMNSKNLYKNSRHFNEKNCGFRVFSDLGDHHNNRLKVEKELEPKRRSISMDSSSASMIYLAIANNLSKENEGSSSTKPVHVVNKPDSDMVGKRLNRNSSLYRLVKNSSFGRSLQKRPVSMKRSFSTTGKQFLSRSQEDSYLPL